MVSDSTKVPCKVFEATVGRDDENQTGSNEKVLKLALLGCECKPPYGPIDHTARMFLEMLVESAKSAKLAIKILMDIYNVVEYAYPKNWDEYNGVIVPGSFSAAYDSDPWIDELKAKLQEHVVKGELPTLGVCFGHQVLAHSFETGTTIHPQNGPWAGRVSMPFQTDLVDLYVSHGDVVVQLPDSAVCLSGDDDSSVPIQIAAYFPSADKAAEWKSTHRGKPFAVTFQAHPEYASSSLGVSTLNGCIDAMFERGAFDEATCEEIRRDAEKTLAQVKKDSIRVMVTTCRYLGWFPDEE